MATIPPRRRNVDGGSNERRIVLLCFMGPPERTRLGKSGLTHGDEWLMKGPEEANVLYIPKPYNKPYKSISLKNPFAGNRGFGRGRQTPPKPDIPNVLYDRFRNFIFSMMTASRCFEIFLGCRGGFSFSSGSIPGFGNRFNVFPVVSIFIGNYKTLAAQASPNEGEETDEVVNQILASGENSPKFSWWETCTYIGKLCRLGNLSEATRLLQSLRDKNVFLPDASKVLLAAAGEKNDIDPSCQIFKDLLVSSRPLSSNFYSNLARAFAKTNDSAALLGFVKEISELPFPESTMVINRIIFGFAACRQIEKALLIFDQLEGFYCRSDLFTYNIVLDILGRAGRVDQMLHEFASMKETNIGPNLISYITLLNNLRRLERLDMCLVFFREMTDCGIEPDLFTYTAMIEILGRSGNIEEALRL